MRWVPYRHVYPLVYSWGQSRPSQTENGLASQAQQWANRLVSTSVNSVFVDPAYTWPTVVHATAAEFAPAEIPRRLRTMLTRTDHPSRVALEALLLAHFGTGAPFVEVVENTVLDYASAEVGDSPLTRTDVAVYAAYFWNWEIGPGEVASARLYADTILRHTPLWPIWSGRDSLMDVRRKLGATATFDVSKTLMRLAQKVMAGAMKVADEMADSPPTTASLMAAQATLFSSAAGVARHANEMGGESSRMDDLGRYIQTQVQEDAALQGAAPQWQKYQSMGAEYGQMSIDDAKRANEIIMRLPLPTEEDEQAFDASQLKDFESE